MADLYDELRRQAYKLWKGRNFLDKRVRVLARTLSTEEAIGDPEGDDFPLQAGKERLMQAEFGNASGQAFTDHYGDFEGTLEEILRMGLENNFRRAIFIATLNAVLRYMNHIGSTVHCRDQGPARCAEELVQYLKTRYGRVKITQIGFQPRIVESLAPHFPLRVIDLDSDNIGTRKFEIGIEGPEATEMAIRWTDLLLVTGTTIVNGSIGQFLDIKPVLFYGTTIAGAAHLMGWERFCPKSK